MAHQQAAASSGKRQKPKQLLSCSNLIRSARTHQYVIVRTHHTNINPRCSAEPTANRPDHTTRSSPPSPSRLPSSRDLVQLPRNRAPLTMDLDSATQPLLATAAAPDCAESAATGALADAETGRPQLSVQQLQLEAPERAIELLETYGVATLGSMHVQVGGLQFSVASLLLHKQQPFCWRRSLRHPHPHRDTNTPNRAHNRMRRCSKRWVPMATTC